MNVRVWKANASQHQGILLNAEKSKQAYNAALIERYSNINEVKKIVDKRYIPKNIHCASRKKRALLRRQRCKLNNIIAQNNPTSLHYCSYKNTNFLKELS